MFNKQSFSAFRPSKRLIGAIGLIMFIIASQLVRPVAFASADTTICGPIASDTTWTPSGNNYIISCDVQVVSGVTLTIEPSVIVKFDPGTSMQVDGTLIAQGCTFTSNNPNPAQGDWGRIYFTPSSVDAVFDSNDNYVSGSIIQDSLIEWGGGGTGVNGSVETNLSSPFINHNTIRNSWAGGIHALGRSAAKPIVIISNSVSGNKGLFVGGGIHASDGNVISNTVSSNGWAGVDGGGIYASASTVTGNFVSANNCDTGCGIYAIGSTLIGNTISGNSGDGSGGGVYASSSTVINNLITGNNAIGGFSPHPGGGIYAVGISTITGNTVSGNSATGNGGGIFVDGGTVSSNTVNSNSTASEGGGIYAVNTTVTANTLSGNSASLGGGVYGIDARLSNNNADGNNATSDGGGIYAEGQTTVMINDVSNNISAQGGGIYSLSTFSGAPNLSGNTLQGNQANFGGGIYAVGSTVRGNTVMSNTVQSDGGGIYAEGGKVEANTIKLNSVPNFGHGAGVFLMGNTNFTSNTVISNMAPGGTVGGVSIDGQPQIHLNNIYNNQPYEAEVLSSNVVSATLNYWGSTLCSDIAGKVYDGDDVPGRGDLIYWPSLPSPVPLAQLFVPSNLMIDMSGSSATLSWTPTPSIPNYGCTDSKSNNRLEGYYVYYDTDSACPPYEGVGLASGDSPIDAGQTTTITLDDLKKQGYYFVVTTYDDLDRESGFSNYVEKPSELEFIHLPIVVNGGQGGVGYSSVDLQCFLDSP